MTDNPSGPTTSPPQRGAGERTQLITWRWLFWAAVVLVVLYIAMTVFTLFRAADPSLTETLWSRTVYLLLGIEAIAFTAVGWLFGREVHRGEAEAVHEQVQDTRTDLDGQRTRTEASLQRAAAAEAKGDALAHAVRAFAAGQGPGGGNTVLPGGPPSGLSGLTDLADSLFPTR